MMNPQKKVENFSFWYQLLLPLLWFGSGILSIVFYDVSKKYGFVGKLFGYLSGVSIFNLFVYLMKMVFGKKFSEYRYLLVQSDKSGYLNILSIIFMIIVLSSGR